MSFTTICISWASTYSYALCDILTRTKQHICNQLRSGHLWIIIFHLTIHGTRRASRVVITFPFVLYCAFINCFCGGDTWVWYLVFQSKESNQIKFICCHILHDNKVSDKKLLKSSLTKVPAPVSVCDKFKHNMTTTKILTTTTQCRETIINQWKSLIYIILDLMQTYRRKIHRQVKESLLVKIITRMLQTSPVLYSAFTSNLKAKL